MIRFIVKLYVTVLKIWLVLWIIFFVLAVVL